MNRTSSPHPTLISHEDETILTLTSTTPRHYSQCATPSSPPILCFPQDRGVPQSVRPTAQRLRFAKKSADSIDESTNEISDSIDGSNEIADSISEKMTTYEFTSLSPSKEHQWEITINSRREEDLKLRLENELNRDDSFETSDCNSGLAPKMSMDEARKHWLSRHSTGPAVTARNSVNNSANINPSDKNLTATTARTTANKNSATTKHAPTTPSAESSSASSLLTNKPNWDVDTLLEQHMKEIDECDFGSLSRCHFLGQQQQNPQVVRQQQVVQQGVGKADGQIKHQQRARQDDGQAQRGQTDGRGQQMQSETHVRMSQSNHSHNQMPDVDNLNFIYSKEENDRSSFNKSNNAARAIQADTPSKMQQITVSDQSTVSSPAWSAAQPANLPQQLGHSAKANELTPSIPPRQSNPVLHFQTHPSPQTPQKEQLQLHTLQLQLNQVTSLNTTLQSKIHNAELQIQQLVSLEEEARQEAALWEAKWRDDQNQHSNNISSGYNCGSGVGGGYNSSGGTLLQDLRGALLQKTTEEMNRLQSKLMELQHRDESVELNLVMSENEVLRRELSRLSDGMIGAAGAGATGAAASPSAAAHSDAMQRLDRMAKTCKESEQKWAARVKEAEDRLDQFRRDCKTLTGENERLKSELSTFKSQENEMETRITRDRGEIDRLIKEKSALVEELHTCRNVIDKARMHHEALRREYELRLHKLTEVHRAELEKMNKSTVDRGTDALPYRDDELESKLDELSQENITLKEENMGISAENERMAKRCVELERSLEEAAANGEELNLALKNAEGRIEELEREKCRLEKGLREIEQRVVNAMEVEDGIRRKADEATAEKEGVERELLSLRNEQQQLVSDYQSLKRENEMLESQNASLEEYHVNAQEELRSWQLAKEEVEAELSATSEENAALKSTNLAMKERLDERQLLLETIRKGEIDGPIAEENRMLKSSISGLEHQLRGAEAALQTERASSKISEQARDRAEKRIGELENQIVSLRSQVNSANTMSASKREDHVRMERQMNELKATITSLREEISAAAIGKSQLELELRRREEECDSLRKRLDPVQQEKYRLELDNADLAEKIEHLRKIQADGEEGEEARAELVKRLEEKNDALAQCITSLQSDMMALQPASMSQNKFKTNTESASHFESKTPKSHRPIISREMMDQLNRARNAVKETASIIKAQRRAISSDNAMPSNIQDPSIHISPIPIRSSDLSESSSHMLPEPPPSASVLPTEITTAMYNQTPLRLNRTLSVDRAAQTPSSEARTNLRSQLEEEHLAEKSAIKNKYKEKMKCMRKVWEGERKAMLSLIASPAVETSGGQYRLVKSPVDSVPRHVLAKESSSSSCGDTETIGSSYLETETFVMNILNELDEK